MIRLDHVSLRQGALLAVEDVSVTFEPGLVAVAGPNGAGKTTLLRAIAGLHPVASGSITGAGLSERIGFLPQSGEVDRRFPITVREFVGFGAWRRVGPQRRLPEAEYARIAASLTRLGIADLADRPIARLSAGQFQRLMFARLLMQDADIFLLDEPFTAVDSETEDALLDIIATWGDQGRTVIAVLHDQDLIQEAFPNTLLLARRMIAYGPSFDVLSAENRRLIRHAA